MLLNGRILERICSLSCFVEPPPFPEELAYFRNSSLNQFESNEEVLTQMQVKLIAVLRLFCAMTANCGTSAVLDGVALFLTRNHVVVSHLLRLRYLTLDGMALTEALTAVLAMLVAIPVSSVSFSEARDNAGNGFALLNQNMNLYISEMCALLHSLG
jgi:hypothetical protein